MTVLGATSRTKEELERFIGFVNSFHPALKFTWKISETKHQSLFSISTFLSKTIIWILMLTTSPHIRTVIYCTHLPTHLMSKTQFPTPNLRLRRFCNDDSGFNVVICWVRLRGTTAMLALVGTCWHLLRTVWNRSNVWPNKSQHFYCSATGEA